MASATETISSSMASSVDDQLNKARDSLRHTDDEIRQITGRTNADEPGNRFAKGRGRISTDNGGREDNGIFGRGAGGGGRFAGRLGDMGRGGFGGGGGGGQLGIKRRVTYHERSSRDEQDNNGEQWKRPRIASEYNRVGRLSSDSSEIQSRVVKPSVQSSVSLPMKETKSREDAITELKGSEKREVAVRNRRMFGVLLGTLKQFKKEEEKHTFKDQERKQKEIESRLEEERRVERAQIHQEKQKLLDKRRRQEQELRRLQRKRALIAANENQIALYRRLQNFIQTNTKPALFFLPAKHTIRTIELQKKTHKKMEELIKTKQEETDAQLKEMEERAPTHLDDDVDDIDDEPEIKKEVSMNDDKSTRARTESAAEDESGAGVKVKRELPDGAETTAAVGEEEQSSAAMEEEQTDEPAAKPTKGIHDELKELTADYAEELNFEDDDQQR